MKGRRIIIVQGEWQLSESPERVRMVFPVQQASTALNDVPAKPRAKIGAIV